MKLISAYRFALGLHILFVILASAITLFGARGDVDPTFNPILTSDVTAYTGGTAVFQPDGKIIVSGTFSNPNLSPGGKFFFRINPDGTPDPTFDCPECRAEGGRVAVQPDGKIIVANTSKIFRVFPDGRLDLSFRIPVNTLPPSCSPGLLIALSSGKILLGCSLDRLFRLNENGSVDPTYVPIVLQGSPSKVINQAVLLPDGKLIMGGGFSGSAGAGWISRYSADGSVDNTFQATPSHMVRGVGLLTDGRYIVTGSFSSINGINKSNYATLLTDGSVDTGFTATRAAHDFPLDVKTLPNGQFYVLTGNQEVGIPVPATHRFVRHNANGSVDSSFSQFHNSSYFWEVDSGGRIITHKSYIPGPARYFRVNFDGTLDAAFNPAIVVPGGVEAAALQSDGKVLIAGKYQKANGVASPNFIRLNPDGSTDPTFNGGTGFSTSPKTIAIQPDGRILAAGDFTGYNFFAQPKFVRINPDGSADTSFTPVVDRSIHAVAPLANGKILIGGDFTTVNGVARTAFARLNADGSLDGTFAPVFANNPTVFAILIQSDGHVMVGGTWSSVNGVGSEGLVRFKPDGSVDSSFLADTGKINQIALRSDGRYIVGTRNVNGNEGSSIFRLNSNGTQDWSFTTRTTGYLETLVLQPSGNIVYGGSGGINRIGPNGEKDIFFPVHGANNWVYDILAQPDGKLIVSGLFSGIEDVGRHGIARLTLSNRIRGTVFDFDGDGRSDVSVYRPSTNTWYEILSATGSIGIQTFGASGDIIAPADYDGDGKTDLGLFRPSLGDWLYISSSTSTVTQLHFGQAGDIPLPSDADANGTADITVYRPSTGQWYGSPSMVFGIAGDQPLIGDFDGDGKSDRAIFRPSNGDWWYAASSSNFEHRNVHWGVTGDLPVPADYDGDAKTDFAVFRPSDGGWYIYNSSDGSFTILSFGTNGDRPAPGDYDGDGRADIAVFRPSTGIWYLYQTTSGSAGLQFGVAGDIPTPNAFVP